MSNGKIIDTATLRGKERERERERERRAANRSSIYMTGDQLLSVESFLRISYLSFIHCCG